jgi:5-methyltetrahydropteroyltriglutamate--homocysteine methyltransferase
MATYFAEEYDGFKISGLVRSYGNRYYRKPIVIGKIGRTKPVTLKWFRFAQSLTDKPVKGMLTGPYTMMDWSFDEYYGSRSQCALALAEVINKEAKDLEKAGAKYIQIDEPAISVRPEELDLAISALRVAVAGLKAKTITHICYGRFELIYPKMLKLPVDQIDLEMSNSGYDMLSLFEKASFTKEIGLGVIDVHSHMIETKDTIKNRIKAAMEVIPSEQICVDPDCGLKTRSQEEVIAKLKVMVQAVKETREELA